MSKRHMMLSRLYQPHIKQPCGEENNSMKMVRTLSMGPHRVLNRRDTKRLDQ